MRRILAVIGCVSALLGTAGSALAQQAIAGYNSTSEQQRRIGPNHWKLTGGVELEQGNTKINADEIEIFADEDHAVATGNVVFSQGANRIAADRADFNTKTRLGTFYSAWGIGTVQPPKPTAARPGSMAPPPLIAGQETRVYFYGEQVDKIGAKKYLIKNGGFTTCVQPTPRWIFTSSTTLLNLEHYTVLHDAVFSVKGVPMLYVPWMYYPTKKEQRATGFLIPTYGSSTLRGQSLHNAFFWAIDRSQDATIAYDWYSKTGQGVGSEYRYNFGSGSDGQIRAYVLDTHETAYTQPDGSTTIVPASTAFEIHGGANQTLPGNLHARGRVDYFSDLATNQTFNTNVYNASLNSRSYGGNLVGAWQSYTLNATYDYSEYFYSQDSSTVSGSAPRVAFSRNERPLFDSDFYFSVASEFAHLLRQTKDPIRPSDSSLGRVDFTPQVRFPFKKWQWFTVNTSVNWRDTFYTRSLNPNDPTRTTIIDQSLNRRFFTFQAQMLGPLFMKIWDTPGNGYAEKFKHSIEPYLNIKRTSSIDNYNQIVITDSTDAIVGGTTSYNYGVTNRFYAKRRENGLAMAREIFDVQLDQTYYTNPLASRYDTAYATSLTGGVPSNFSPFAVSLRALPTNDINVVMRAEFDSQYRKLRTISAGGSYSWASRVQTTITWSKKGFIAELPGFNNPALLDHYINGTANVHTRDNRVGGIYSMNYDVLHSALLQHRISLFYNAQCCGVAAEYQAYNYNVGGVSTLPVPADHRFFLSFTLAGLGNFSPFNGALSGVPR